MKAMTMPRNTYHHKDLRQALIETALLLIAEKDISSVSLREVARRVGVSHTAPYRHFADKDALLAAVAEEGFQALAEFLQEAVQQADQDPLKRLEMSGVAYVRYAIAHPAHYRVMFGAYKASETMYPSLVEASEQTFMVLVNAIALGQNAGVIRTQEPKELAWAAWSLVHGLAMLLIDGQLSLTDSQQSDIPWLVIIRVFVEGLTIRA